MHRFLQETMKNDLMILLLTKATKYVNVSSAAHMEGKTEKSDDSKGTMNLSMLQYCNSKRRLEDDSVSGK
ncbi:hypothetical protein QQG55_15700 [Brugia pahangi]|uniref:Ovule protein n=1 Tax=Brugia pahangi TaxID=6280 RepID=A0A0N4TI98_BRUPA|nr:unnamed protein product [Brugia pahangi]